MGGIITNRFYVYSLQQMPTLILHGKTVQSDGNTSKDLLLIRKNS